jgi:cell division protein FtsA
MEKKKILSIDVGSFQVKAYLAETDDNGTRISEKSFFKSAGFAGGKIVDIEKLAEVFLNVKREFMPIINECKIVIGISGLGMATHFALGSVEISDGCVDKADIDQVSETSSLTTKFEAEEVLHIIPKNYRLDGCVCEDAPINKRGRRLECECSVITVEREGLNSLKRALQAADIKPDYIVANIFAIYSIADAEIADKSYILLSSGAENTEAVFCENHRLMNLYSVPLGGNCVNAALEEALDMDFVHAEQLKRMFSSWSKTELYGKGQIINCSYENHKDNDVQYDVLYDIIDSSVRRIVAAVNEKTGIDLIDRDIHKVYFTGGCSLLYNLAENIQQMMGFEPVSVKTKAADIEYIHPENIAGYCAAVYVGRRFVPKTERAKRKEAKAKAAVEDTSLLGRLKNFFKK